jgi:hypothetical protein
MVRAHSRASALSVIPGNRRGSSMVADSSPLLLEGGADRDGGLETTNMAGSVVMHAAASADYRA